MQPPSDRSDRHAWISLFAGLLVASSLALPAGALPTADADSDGPASKISPWLRSRLEASSGTTEMLVILQAPPDLSQAEGLSGRAEKSRYVYDSLRSAALTTQAPLLAWLKARGIEGRPFWIVNAVLVEGNPSLAESLAAFPGVARIVGNPRVRGVPVPELAADAAAAGGWSREPRVGPASGGGRESWSVSEDRAPTSLVAGDAAASGGEAIEYGVAAVNADKVWTQRGVRGEGIVVAIMDTGVEWTHQALQSKYRGWDGGLPDHSYSWHDPIESTLVPWDDYGHGTHVTGTVVGDDGAGNQIGVAPAARWIACRNMDRGYGTPASYMACAQWGLAPYPPGGNPFEDGRPELGADITNNSWTCPPIEGCDALTLLATFDNLRAAGQMTVAAAGNGGSSCSSVAHPPAIYDSVFSVGALGTTLSLAGYSSRGPVTADGSGRLKPNIAAPGSSVRSSVRGGLYGSSSGTSMASPHASGSLALLWSARPALKRLIGTSRCYVEQSARLPNGTPATCGGTLPADKPNNMWGWGLVDALGAIDLGPDSDADGIADQCDCAPANGGAFAIPPLVAGNGFSGDGQTLKWNPLAPLAGAGTTYDVVRGIVSELRADGGFAAAACLADDLAATALADTLVPPPGEASYYLVRGQNACASGSYGSGSNRIPRAIAACF